MNDLKNEDKINILKIYDEIYTNKIKNDDIQEQKNDEKLKEENIQIHYYNMEEMLRKKIQNIIIKHLLSLNFISIIFHPMM